VRRALPLLLAALAGCSAPAPKPAPVEPAAAAPKEAKEAGEGPDYVNLGPQRIDDLASVGVGEPVPSFSFTDIHGVKGELSSLLAGKKGLVVVLTSTGCPVSKNYHPELEELAKRSEARGMSFLAVDPSITDTSERLRAKAGRVGWTFRITLDPDYAISDACQARRTTPSFLIDAEGILRYRGAIDDQYGINYRLEAPRNTYLLDAVDALSAGEPIQVPATTSPGCRLSRVRMPD
jgi:thiol-disulfide isomerase/thioredoxin